ncbi:Predicted oxidoreductase [Alteribacillus persepolensis]|uniref:Predicted oxidoreductase n=1 Tax=Alteribacillus persepolensis TaxID=568899 RepID=A0A1G8C1H4_9BACI|nr:aldo/keto reductase [Alteribacillus persepolensis]SDH39326.1 Predicted oxidoreductase [Alteribacillus persepolensis]
MKYRTLGKTGMEVSVIGLGTWQFGGEWGHDYNQSEVDAIFDKARETGINFIDTAECYGDHLSEEFIGKAIERDRDQWVLATKFGHKFHGMYDRTRHYSAKEVQQQLEDSLRALRTDYIDLYQFHSGVKEEFDNDDLWTMLDKQVQAGKIRHVGLSIKKNNDTYQTKKASEIGAETIQVVYNRLDRTPEEGVFPACEEQNLGVLARVPLASGYLSGKYKPGATFAENDVRHKHDQDETRRKLELVSELQQNEVPEDVPMAEWALAWCLKHSAVTSVIPGCKNPDQVASNAKAADLDIVRPDHPQSSR